MENKRLLGIDFGSKRIGIALTDESGALALPYSVVENSSTALGEILKICVDNHVSKIVIGESKNYSGADNSIMKDIKNFVEHIQQSGLEIVLHPEFLSSFQAERTNYELHGKKDMLDASSATIILQSYIDGQK